jgi:hypothetical protein
VDKLNFMGSLRALVIADDNSWVVSGVLAIGRNHALGDMENLSHFQILKWEPPANGKENGRLPNC